jgi:hypothetical protein
MGNSQNKIKNENDTHARALGIKTGLFIALLENFKNQSKEFEQELAKYSAQLKISDTKARNEHSKNLETRIAAIEKISTELQELIAKTQGLEMGEKTKRPEWQYSQTKAATQYRNDYGILLIDIIENLLAVVPSQTAEENRKKLLTQAAEGERFLLSTAMTFPKSAIEKQITSLKEAHENFKKTLSSLSLVASPSLKMFRSPGKPAAPANATEEKQGEKAAKKVSSPSSVASSVSNFSQLSGASQSDAEDDDKNEESRTDSRAEESQVFGA